jgi:hypothetical protein
VGKSTDLAPLTPSDCHPHLAASPSAFTLRDPIRIYARAPRCVGHRCRVGRAGDCHVAFCRPCAPRLTEVERVRRDIDEAAVGRTISRVETTIDEIIFDGVRSDEFERALVGRKVLTSERRGKK